MKKLLKRLLKKPNWYNLRNLKPISKVFALDRGTPIDKVYIEDFLSKNRDILYLWLFHPLFSLLL